MARPSDRLRELRSNLIENFKKECPDQEPDFNAVWQESMESYLDEMYDERVRSGDALSAFFLPGEEQDGKAE